MHSLSLFPHSYCVMSYVSKPWLKKCKKESKPAVLWEFVTIQVCVGVQSNSRTKETKYWFCNKPTAINRTLSTTECSSSFRVCLKISCMARSCHVSTLHFSDELDLTSACDSSCMLCLQKHTALFVTPQFLYKQWTYLWRAGGRGYLIWRSKPLSPLTNYISNVSTLSLRSWVQIACRTFFSNFLIARNCKNVLRN